MSAHLGRIEVSTEMLARWMGLPSGSVIRQVSDAGTVRSLYFEVVVEHPSLPLIEEGGLIPIVDYTATERVVEGRFNVPVEDAS